MPSEESTWLVAVPHEDETESVLLDVSSGLSQQSPSRSSLAVAPLAFPSFKTGTLESLISLSEELPKHDAYFTSAVAKIVETIRNLLNDDPAKLHQHVQVNDVPPDDYLLGRGQGGWKWNERRYGLQKSLREIADLLVKEMISIDNVSKNKLNNYNLAKGSLVQMQRKKAGNLSVRSLVDVVSPEVILQDSEYLDTVFVAVPRNLVKEWNSKYERLSPMVVPRSSKKIAEDDEFVLHAIVMFKRHRDDFAQKCRENKFVFREFEYSEEQMQRQQADLSAADESERELWTELLRLSRTNFSESYQLLMHLKVVQAFVECVLRYGLPAHYVGVVIKPDTKNVKKNLSFLTSHFRYLAPRTSAPKTSSNKKKSEKNVDVEIGGEFQQIMDQEYFDFVLFEIPWIVR